MDESAVQRKIEAALSAYRTPGQKRDVSGENGLIARISAHAERDDCNAEPLSGSLIEHQRAHDAVLFYARQDAAHALLNTASILGQIDRLQRRVWVLLVVGVLGLLALFALCGLLAAIVMRGSI